LVIMLAYLLKSPGSSFFSFRSFLSLFFCSEGLQEPDLHDHKVRQDGKNEGVVPDVQVQIEMKEKGKKQRQVKKRTISDRKKKRNFFPAVGCSTFFKSLIIDKLIYFECRRSSLLHASSRTLSSLAKQKRARFSPLPS